MRSYARVSLLALIAGVLVAFAVPAAASAAGFGITKFFAANCKASAETCGLGAEEPSKTKTEEEGYVQAGGHPPYGVTDFVIANHEQTVPFPAKIPNESVQNLRTDVAPGVVTNPEAVPKCSIKDFEGTLASAEHGFYTAGKCPTSSVIGENTVVTAVPVAEPEPGHFIYKDFTLKGKVYNLEQPYGLASDFGVALDVKELGRRRAAVRAHVHQRRRGMAERLPRLLHDHGHHSRCRRVAPGLLRNAQRSRPGRKLSFLRNPSKCRARSRNDDHGDDGILRHEKAERPYTTLVGS